MSRKAYIVIKKAARHVRLVVNYQDGALEGRQPRFRSLFEIYGPYATEAEATDNLEGEPNPALRIY